MAKDIGEIKDRIAGCLWGQAIGESIVRSGQNPGDGLMILI